MLAGLAVVAVPHAAHARFDPVPSRMAVTDTSATVGLQARVWMATRDGELVSKDVDQPVHGWMRYGGPSVTSGLGGVTTLAGGVLEQRVFYVASKRLQEIGYDDMVPIAAPLPTSSYSFVSGTSVAAVQFDDNGVEDIAVAAIMEAGHVCVWEGTFHGFSTSPSCYAGTAGTDIAGIALESGSTPVFFYSGGKVLQRLHRVGANSYSLDHLSLPGSTMADSVSVTASSIEPGYAEVGLAVDGTPAFVRSNASGSPTEDKLPALPGGAKPLVGLDAVTVVAYNAYNQTGPAPRPWPST